ncbi:MAG: heat-shock protein Hsp20 [Deltaproteobacteria bacterium RIFOXYD12_FULL_57_12]|nr:MAG: heat-shock protein Hsp20 [Deltaproteobacteria bacterium RIFOXYD12_FULL_57_12]
MENVMNTEIMGQDKKEIQQAGEPTRPGKQFIPAVDIFENEKTVTVIAEMPGVGKDDLVINLEEGVLTISGEATWKGTEQETILAQEFEAGRYIRKFTLAETIDQENVEATIAEGILVVTLPKIEPAKPRKITVKTG